MARLEEFELRRDNGDERPLIIRGEARLPDNATGTVVICHGFKGFAKFSFFPYLAEQLAAAGLTAITFDFSGSGVGDDRENFTNPEAFTHNTFLQELDDLESVVIEARVHDWIDGPYGVFGHSRGGGIAILHAARDENVSALVTWAAISSTNRWSPEVVADWRRRGFIDVPNARTGDVIPLGIDLLHEVEKYGETTLNIGRAASRVKAPWLIMHGANDETVPVAEAVLLGGQAPEAEVRTIENVDHSFGGKHPLTAVTPTLQSVTRETVAFFDSKLSPSAV